MKNSIKIQAICAILRTLLQNDYENTLATVQRTQSVLSQGDETKLLLEATVPVLRSHIIQFLTKNFDILDTAAIAKYLNLE